MSSTLETPPVDPAGEPTRPAIKRAKPTSLRQAAPAIFALCLVMLVEMVDNSVLNVALPTIARDLAVGPSGLQWIVAAYSLTFGGLLIVGGTLGDRLGRRRVLLWGLIGMGAAGAATLLVSNAAEFIALRAVAGAAAALVAPGTMSLGMRLFDDDGLRRRMIGIVMTVAMLGFAAGPILSGLAITHLPWQALLVVNLPIAVIAYLGVRHGIDPDHDADLRAGGSDVPGAVLSVTALSLSLYVATLGVDHGWTAWPTLVCALLAVLAWVAFVIRERSASDPMLDLKLFAHPTVRGSALLQTAVMVGMVGVSFASTQIFQFAWGWSALQAAFGTLPMVIGMFVASPIVEALIQRRGHRAAAATGAVMLVLSLLLLTVSLGHGYPMFAAGVLLLSMATRFVMTTCAVELVDALPESHTGVGAALNDTAQEVGNSVGVAIVGTVIAAVIGTSLPPGAWSTELTENFLHAMRIAFPVLAGIVTVMGVAGVRTLSDARTLEEH